jgi:hypothetical protein
MMRRLTALAVVLAMVVAFPLAAMADTRNVSAYCPASAPGGFFRSTGTVLNYQKHSKSGFVPQEWNYTGVLTKTKNWGGGFIGLQSAVLFSPNTFSSAYATCPG